MQTFLEYKMVKRGERIERETNDYVADEQISENRIVPDAALFIENIETKKRALFFLEMDMATERIATHITRDKTITLHHKMSQYDRYLQSLRYRETYAAYGKFGFFTMLFITLNKERVEHIRQSTHDLPQDLAQYYRLTTYAQAMGDFLGEIWLSRSPSDTQLYPLVRESRAEAVSF